MDDDGDYSDYDNSDQQHLTLQPKQLRLEKSKPSVGFRHLFLYSITTHLFILYHGEYIQYL